GRDPDQGPSRAAAARGGLARRSAALLHHARDHHRVRRTGEVARRPLPAIGARSDGGRMGEEARGLFEAVQPAPLPADALIRRGTGRTGAANQSRLPPGWPTVTTEEAAVGGAGRSDSNSTLTVLSCMRCSSSAESR